MITRKIRTAIAFFAAVILVGLMPLLASAASVYWSLAGTGNWTDGTNWSTNPSIPGAGDLAHIGLGGTAQLASATTVTDFRAGHGTTNPGDGTVELNTGADLNLTNAYIKLTAGYTGTVNHNDGALNVNGGSLHLGYASGTGDAIYNLIGGTLNFTGGADLVMAYRGTFNWTGGSLTGVDKVQVGSSAGDYKSVFNLGGNTLSTTGIVEVGRGGGSQADEFNFQGGEVITDSYFMVGGSTALGGTVVDLGPTERLETTSHLYVGYVGNALGVFNQNGGDLDIGDNLLMAGAADSTGIFNLNAGDVTFTGGDIDMQRTSTFNWNAGTITGVDKVQVGSAGGDYKSVFNLNGMTLTTASNVDVGRGGGSQADEFNFQGGEVIAGTYFLVGGSTAPGGTVVDLNPTERLETGTHLYVGYTANTLGVFNQNGGDLDITNTVIMGGTADSNGTFNLNAGDLTFTGPSGIIDMQRTSTFNWNAGTITGASSVKVGTITGDYKSVFNLGGHTLATTSTVEVGRGGGSQADEFNFQGGTVNAGAYFMVGGSTAPGGTVVNLNTGDTLSTTSHLYVGYVNGALGVFSQNGGSLTIGDDLLLSNTTNAQGLYRQNGGTTVFTGASDIVMDRTSDVEINGGTLSGVNNLNIGVAGTGTATYTQNGGSVSINSFVRVGDNAGDEDFFNMTGGTFTMNNIAADFLMENDSTANISGGTLNLSRDMLVSTIAGQTSTVNQSGGLVDIANNLNLATNSTATGNYNLTGGTLNVAGVVDLIGAGTEYFELNGGTLQALTINDGEGNFTFTSGILTPGEINVPETLTFNGNLTMSSGSVLYLDLSTPGTIGGPNDLLDVQGDLVLDGLLELNALPGFVGSGKYPIITFSGTLTDLGLDVTNPNLMSITIEGNTVFLNLVPEPNSALLLGTGLLGMAWRRRRKA